MGIVTKFIEATTNWLQGVGLDGWEKWAFLAVIIGVIVNAAFLWALIVQIKQGRKALAASQRSSDAAQDAVEEARRARVDEQAPKVVAILDEALVHGLKTKDSFGVNSEPIYKMPKMRNDTLLLITTGKLINEGRSTARVRLDGNGACFLGEDDDDPFFVTEIIPAKDERILRPGDTVRFAWSDGHTIEDWTDAYNNPSPPNPKGACFMSVTVRDYQEDGVIDHIYLEMSGRPIKAVEGENGRWQHNVEGSIAATSYPIHRTYRQEGWKGVTPPWTETYAEWEKQNTDKDT